VKQVFVIFIICLSFSSLVSQVVIKEEIPKKEKKDKLKFVFNFDNRNSFVIGHKVKFQGIKIGLGNRKYRFGLGFYNTRKAVVRIDDRVDDEAATDTTLFTYGYSSLYYERILFQNKRWEFSAPVHLNFGDLKASYIDTLGNGVPFFSQKANSLTLSLKAHFKIWRWLGVGTGVGYNFMLSGDNRVRRALNAPFYSYGIKVFIGELWRLTFNKEYRKSEWTY
jgi:hypothetical protein